MTMMIRIGNIAPTMVITSYMYATSEGLDVPIPPCSLNRAFNIRTFDVCNLGDLCT